MPTPLRPPPTREPCEHVPPALGTSAVITGLDRGGGAAIQQACKQGQIQVYSYDATPEVVATLRGGRPHRAAGPVAALQAAKSIEAVVSYLKVNPGGKPITKAAQAEGSIPTKILTRENVDSSDARDYLYKPPATPKFLRKDTMTPPTLRSTH